MSGRRRKFKSVLCATVAFAVVALDSAASAATFEVSRPTGLTCNSAYDRNPSIVHDGVDYRLFYTKGDDTSTGGVRGGGYDPDSDTYVVYYKTAASIEALVDAEETKLDLSESARPAGFDQRVVSAVVLGGQLYAIVSSGQSGTNRGMYYYKFSGGAWSGPVTLIADTGVPNRGGHVNAVSDGTTAYIVWECADGSSDFYTFDGVSLSAKVDISTDNMPKITLMGSTLYVVSIEDGTGDVEVYSSSDGGATWGHHSTAIAGAGLYDPCIFTDGSILYVVCAPWVPPDRQYLVQTRYESGAWSPARTVSYGGYGGVEWWDYWPCGYYDGSDLCLFFTTEADQYSLGDGEIAYARMDWDLDNDHYFVIQTAVNQASPGDTINVADGVYGADPATGKGVYITKDDITLTGQSASGTIIDGALRGVGASGSFWPKGIHVQADNVTIRNFCVRNFTGDLSNTGGYGVLFRDYDHDELGEGYIFYDGCTAENVIARDNYFGIYGLCFTNLTVSNCAVRDNLSDGIFIARGSDYATVEGNVVSNSGDHGIWVGYSWTATTPSNHATITNNDVNGAREGGISFVGSDTAVIAGNVITNAAGDGWSVGALSIKDGSSNVEAYNNTIYNNSGTWNGYAGTGHGVGIDGPAVNINLHHNNIYGNSGYGCYNASGAVVAAENNWWGDASGPADPAGTVEVPPCEGVSVADMLNADGAGDQVSDDVDYCPWLTAFHPANANSLVLDVEAPSLYVQVGQSVVVHMDVLNLLQKVNGCQALLGYSSTYLSAGPGCVVPGGGVWDELIYNSWDAGSGVPGEIDTAIGVNVWGHIGTDEDGTVAILTLTAETEGTTNMVFRPDGEGGYATMLADMNAQPVWPTKIDSQTIVIDSTLPAISVDSATQDGQELLVENGSSLDAVQGVVSIAVGASDALAGLDGAPSVTVTPNGAAAQAATFVSESPAGVFNYTWTVSADTPNGIARIDAAVADKSGNVANATAKHFNINKNQITGQVELEGFVGTHRAVTFTATGGIQTKSWTRTLAFSAAVAPFTLKNVPEGTTHLSAKTAWHLRRKVPAASDGDGQATADFTGSGKLLAGDINGDNMVQILDYSLVKIYWYTHNPVADINGDWNVSFPDYLLMKGNWFTRGDDDGGGGGGGAGALEVPSCATLAGDLNLDCRVDGADFSFFALSWMDAACSSPDFCGGADIDESGKVDWTDFSLLAANWLQCNGPNCD